MRKQFLAVQLLIMSVAISATAGGVGSTETCAVTKEILVSAPLNVYLPDGMTEQAVGEASIVSRKSVCKNGEYEVIDIDLQLADEIKPYGIKIKDAITAFENSVSLDFRLKQLVNSAEYFDTTVYGTTKVTHFGGVGLLNVAMEKPQILFWINTKSQIDSVITAIANGQSTDDRPLRCSLEKAYVILTLKPNDFNGLQKDLRLSAFFRGPLQLCP